MSERLIEIEADTLADARRRLSDMDAIIVLHESVLCGGDAGTVEAVADTVEEALAALKDRVPAGAVVEAEDVLVAPRRVSHRAEADDEEQAAREVSPREHETVESVSLHRKGRRGFFGFFKRPAVYEVLLFQRAVVAVRYRLKARICATVRGYLAEDLSAAVRAARESGAAWPDVLRLLNPKADQEIPSLLNTIRDPNFFDEAAVLALIEDACRKNKHANWRSAIEAARAEAARVRAKFWVELRGLDVELADAFMFYTSIDWYPKAQREPTGIPKERYDERRPLDRQYRETIPRYSSDRSAFCKLRERAVVFLGSAVYRQCLDDEGLDEASAKPRQMCAAILKARKAQLRGGRPDF